MDNPIPVLSLTSACASSILDAARDLGFLYIALADSGLSSDQISNLFEISQRFFSTSTASKQPFAINPNNRGWSAQHSETLDPATQERGDFKQAFNIGEFTCEGKAQQSLPPTLQEDEKQLAEFAEACHVLCRKLLSRFAVALGLEEEFFHDSHDQTQGSSGSILRLLYYPPVPEEYGKDVGDIRAGAHSDYGSVTLLFQRPGEPGLEILMPGGGGWKKVPVLEDAICVNIGDLLSYWTAGLLRSTVHRVVGQIGGSERYSVAYFCHPVDTTLLEPIPAEMVQKKGKRGANEGEVVTAGVHLVGRLKATYGWGKVN